MNQFTSASSSRLRIFRSIVALCVLLTALVVVPAEPAQAQNVQTIQVWGANSGEVWKYQQSVAGNDLGTANAADPALDDSAWGTKVMPWDEIVGPNNANHFRKTFDIDAILPPGVQLSQVVGINVGLKYDDTAVMYLNGTEVYRSIRGNLDPDYNPHPLGANMWHDINVPWGGAENFYVQIPDPGMVNMCEIPAGPPECPASPYGSAQPPAIPTSLLVPGDNVWSVTVWNQSGGGSGDGQLDHVFELVIDTSIPAPQVKINETMASNATTYEVQLDLDPELETPDWIELVNIDPNDPADISNWTIGDPTATWTIPAGTVIPAGGHLILAANDGDDPTTTPMQTNFKLSSSGDSLTLVTDTGIVADEYVWTDQFTDNSFGRPNDDHNAAPTYLLTPTVDAINSGPLTAAPPILRYFRDRIYNPGETVDLSINAFDPDGDPLTYSVAPLPTGVTLDSATGIMTGTFDHAADLTSTITITDGDNDTDTQTFTWFRVEAPIGSSPLVLNEYNAVPSDGELNSGSPIGNGGDWFEFLVVEDNVDLRGWTIEFRQRDSNTDELRRQTFATFANRVELARVPAGTIITVSEQNADDLSFDADTDWSINLLMDNFGNGPFWGPAGVDDTFNSTRRDQTVVIRNAAGQVVTPLVGESDGWDAVNGGVSAGEVMSLCLDIVTGDTVDPIADYLDNGVDSSFGQPNTCYMPDPNDPAVLIADPQDLAPLRASASLGAGTGDVNCDMRTDIVDALLISQLEVDILTDDGPCLLNQGGPGHIASEIGGDFNDDGVTNIVDALIIARCEAGIASVHCPNA